MTAFLARIRIAVGVLVLLAAVVAWRFPPARSNEESRRLRQSDRKLGAGRAAVQGDGPDQRPLHAARPEGLHDRAAGRPRLAPLQPGDAAVDRRPSPSSACSPCWCCSICSAAWCGSRPGAPAAPWCASTRFERFVHWMTAVCFIVLALSGLNITFGKDLLLPLIGPEAFTGWSQWAKYAHNYLSFPFTHRRRADLPDVDRRQYPEPRRRRVGQGGRRHRRPRAIRRPSASTPARR